MVALLLAACVQAQASVEIGNSLIPRSDPGYKSDDVQTQFVLDFSVQQSALLQSVLTYSQGPSEGTARWPGTQSAGGQFYLYVLRPDTANPPGSYYDIVYRSAEITVGSQGINTYSVSSFAIQPGDVIAHWGNGIPFGYLSTVPDPNNSTMWSPLTRLLLVARCPNMAISLITSENTPSQSR
jgi:hypothetical protein